LAAFLTIGAWPVFPQTVTATQVGTVTDASGARVVNAEVTATIVEPV